MECLTSECGDEVLFYFPFKKSAFFADQKTSKNIISYLKSGTFLDVSEEKTIIDVIEQIRIKRTFFIQNNIAPADGKKAIIIPTEKCNLACTYCYAKQSHSKQQMNINQLVEIAKYMFSKTNEGVYFSFIGGGEPFMCWDKILEFAEFCLESKHKYHINITTNGTLFNKERVELLTKYHISVSISYDILPDIQKHNRPFVDGRSTVDVVESNIRLLLEQNIVPPIRSTITPQYVERMGEMVEYVHQNFPEIKRLHFEQESSTDSNVDSSYYDKFIYNFFIALRLAEQYGIDLSNSAINSTKVLKDHFCRGELCFTPYGHIVSCHRISTPSLNHYSEAIIGESSPISLNRCSNINIPKNRPECNDCISKYHCAGGCYFNNLLYGEKQFEDYCNFMKTMMFHYIRHKLKG